MTNPNINQLMAEAVSHHRAGRRDEAQKLYRQVLARQGNHVDALRLLGSVVLDAGGLPEALELMQKAVAADGNSADARAGMGRVLAAMGRADEAIAEYGRALALRPGMVDVQYNLGNLLMRIGRNDEAIASFGRAVAARPDFAEAHQNLGIALMNGGRIGESITAYRKALAIRPDYPEAQSNLGIALRKSGQLDLAIAAYRQAVKLRPEFVEAIRNLGDALGEKGELDEAIALCRKALAMRPRYPHALLTLGNVLQQKGRHPDAIATLRSALAIEPKFPEALSSLANALWHDGQIDAAVAACNEALAIRPDYGDAYSNLAMALWRQDQVEPAMAAAKRAIELNPNLAEAHINLGIALTSQNKLDEAIVCYHRAIALNNNALAHFNLATVLLEKGELAAGWPEYEWRWRAAHMLAGLREVSGARWDGSPLNGRRILVHTEQGLGDSIQFMRYLPMVAARGGRIILECQQELVGLVAGLAGIGDAIERFVPRDFFVRPLEERPEYDLQCPLLSLPELFGTTLENIPAFGAYLTADAKLIENWRERVASLPAGRKIGLAWGGSPTHANDRNRSIALSALAGLSAIADAVFVSLQKGPAGQQAHQSPGLTVIDPTEELSDFADTAALVANLDLVIAVDTSIAHLAAAMGKPTWILLPFAPDWRWLLGRDDSVWYSSVRLFRQVRAGDWAEPVGRVIEALGGRSA